MRRPLTYPQLDENLVAVLVPLARELDGLVSAGSACTRERDEFNALAGTSIDEPLVFHFSGACTAEDFVRDLLARKHVRDFAGLDDDDILDLLRSINIGARSDKFPFWLEVLELNLPGAPISDLVFYPERTLKAFGIADVQSGELAPEDILRLARSILPRAPVLLGLSTRDGFSR